MSTEVGVTRKELQTIYAGLSALLVPGVHLSYDESLRLLFRKLDDIMSPEEIFEAARYYFDWRLAYVKFLESCEAVKEEP